MYRNSVFTSCARLDVRDNARDQIKPSRREGFTLSALGRKMVSAFKLRKSQNFHPCNLNDAQRMLYSRRNSMPCDGQDFCLMRLSSIRAQERLDNTILKRLSASPSIRASSLPGLSYVASFNNDFERSFYKGFSLEQAAKVVSSSTIRSRPPYSPASIGCNSPCDVFTSFSDDSEDCESPLFDPDLLNVFERALEQLPVPSTEETRTSEKTIEYSTSLQSNFLRQKANLHDGSGSKESNTSRKRLSFGASEEFMSSIPEQKETKLAKKDFEGLAGNPRTTKEEMNLKRIVSAITTTNYDPEYTKINLLDKFQFLCPPGGEHKLVLFLTSLRGVRKTYENCKRIRTALSGHGVKIDERDVSMHSEFRRELKDLFGKSVSLPRLFIRGRYVGGVEEVIQLNEDGVLAKLLEDVPRTTSRSCEGCGDIRFIPCTECSGSCKVVSYENKVVRCPCCNENGLVRCTICC